MTRIGEWIDLGAARVALVLALLGALLGLLARRYDTFPADIWIAAHIRSLGETFEPVANVFNEGDEVIAPTVVVLLTIGLIARHQTNAALLVLITALMRPLLNLAKMLVDRPRPSGGFEVLDVVYDSSFPSGHTMTAVLVFGLLFILAAEIVPRPWAWLLRAFAATAIAIMALSRIWAGVHWPSDTYGALLWSGALIAFGLALRPSSRRFCSWFDREWISRVRGRTAVSSPDR